MEVDIPRRRIGLSMKTNPEKAARSARESFAERDGRGNAPRRGGFGGFGGNGNAFGRRDNRGNDGSPRRFSTGGSSGGGFGSLGDFFK